MTYTKETVNKKDYSSKITDSAIEELLNSDGWVEVKSSWISRVLFRSYESDSKEGLLFIKNRSNKGIDYLTIYSSVTESIYKGFLLADSKGKYYHSYIKYKYNKLQTIKLTPEEDIRSLPSIRDLKSGYFPITTAT